MGSAGHYANAKTYQERELEEIITKNLEHSWFLAQQEPYINVLLLNLALDHSFGRINS